MTTFAGKSALIIGAGQNIGRRVAQEWARRGARLAVADISREGAEETAALLRAAGAEAHAFACDVASEASVLSCIDAAEAALGPLDILMNNAGILSGGNPEDIPMSEWQRMFDINLFGMVRANNVIMPRMIARGCGHIVNTASFAGFYPFAASRVHYAACKAAVLSMSENLALYLMPLGVKVSCLIPGPVMTTSTTDMKEFSDSYVMRAPAATCSSRASRKPPACCPTGWKRAGSSSRRTRKAGIVSANTPPIPMPSSQRRTPNTSPAIRASRGSRRT